MGAPSWTPMLCRHCEKPMARSVWVGDFPYHPKCVRGPDYQIQTDRPLPPNRPNCVPATPLNEADIRRIVREEIDAITKDTL